MSKQKDVLFAETVSTLEGSMLRLEGLSATRNALQSIVADEIKSVDKQRAEARTAIKDSLFALADCTLACKAASPVGVAPTGADDKVRQRFQRRRNWLKAALTAAYPDYTTEWQDRRFIPTFIGDEATRTASKIFSYVQQWIDAGKPADVKELATYLKQSSNAPSEAPAVQTVAAEHAALFASVTARVATMAEAMKAPAVVPVKAPAEPVKEKVVATK